MAVDFFKKHAWKPNEVDWHFLVIFDKEPGITKLAEDYTPLLKHPGLYNPIPAKWLHMTVLRVGDDKQISEDQMEQVCQRIEQQIKEVSLPTTTLEQPWVWSGSVCLKVTPEEQVQKLFAITAEACDTMLDQPVERPHPFIPHVTLAYPKDTDDETGIAEQLQQEQVEPFRFRPTEMCLVRQRQHRPIINGKSSAVYH